MARTGPTQSGLPTVVLGGMESTMFISLGRLAHHGGFGSVAELLAAVDEGEAPRLPYCHRVAGQQHCDVLLAQAWLDDLVRMRDKAPKRTQERAAREAQEIADAQQRSRDREQAKIARSREQQQMWRALEAEAQQREVAEQQAHAARPVIAPLKGVGHD